MDIMDMLECFLIAETKIELIFPRANILFVNLRLSIRIFMLLCSKFRIYRRKMETDIKSPYTAAMTGWGFMRHI